MHIGKNNSKYAYSINGHMLNSVDEEKDLGIIVTSDMKSSRQCRVAYNKAARILGVVNRTIKFKNKQILLSLYKTLVRPLVEYCAAAWSPHYAKDKHLLERIQHRFTRMFPGLRRLPYERRLDVLGLWSLEERRNRADLIEVFKIVKGFSSICPQSLFEFSTDSRTRGHTLKLVKHRCNTDLRKHFFSERITGRWNKLSQSCVDSTSINGFKQQLAAVRTAAIGFFTDSESS